MSVDDQDDDAGRMHRRGRGLGKRHDGARGVQEPPIPGKATLAERLPPAHPAAVVRNAVRSAAGAVSRIQAMVTPLVNAVAAVVYLESGRLSFEIRAALRRAETALSGVERDEHAAMMQDEIAAARAQLAALAQELTFLLRAAPVLEQPGAGSEEAERAWKARHGVGAAPPPDASRAPAAEGPVQPSPADLERAVIAAGARGAVAGDRWQTLRQLAHPDRDASPTWADEAAAIAPRLGLGAVEVKTNDTARAITDAKGARGAALGGTVYLHPDRIQPGTPEGREVLAHELVHLAQSRLTATPVGDGAAAARGEAEAEAAELAGQLARGGADRAPRRFIDLARPAADTDARHAIPAVTPDGARHNGDPTIGSVLELGRNAMQLAEIARVTLVPGYRRAVDALDLGASIELATHVVSAVRAVDRARKELTQFFRKGTGPEPGVSAQLAEAYLLKIQLETELPGWFRELVVQLGPQTFRGVPVMGAPHPPAKLQDPIQYLANEAGVTVELLAVIADVRIIAGQVGDECPALTADQRKAIAAAIEPWRRRPINLAFLTHVLERCGLWTMVAAEKGPSGRTLSQTVAKSEAQAAVFGNLADVGDFDFDQVEKLIPGDADTQAIMDFAGQGDDQAMKVYEMIGSAAPDARGPLVRHLERTNRLATICKHLPWKHVEAMSDAVVGYDGKAAAILDKYWADRSDHESLHQMYMNRVDDNIDDGDDVQAFGWYFLDFLSNAFTAGFHGEYSAAYDAYQQGIITENQFSSAATKALGKAALVTAVSALTGGAAGELAAGFAAPLVGRGGAALIGGGVGGFTGGFSGHFTADVYDQALSGKDGFDSAGDYLKSGALGGVMGTAGAGISIGGAKYLPGSATRMADIYARRFPRMTRALEAVRRVGEGHGTAVKMSVNELLELLRNNLGGPGGPSAFAMAGGGDVRLLPGDTEVTVTLRPTEDLDRPMQMSAEEQGPQQGATKPVMAIDSVEVEPIVEPVASESTGVGDDIVAEARIAEREASDVTQPATTHESAAAPKAPKAIVLRAQDVIEQVFEEQNGVIIRFSGRGPNGEDVDLALAHIELDDLGDPLSGPDFVIDTRQRGGIAQLVDGDGARVPVTGHVLDHTLEYFKSRFGRWPDELPGHLAWKNLENFQREFAAARRDGAGMSAAGQQAIRNISYGTHRSARGYAEFEVTIGDLEQVVTADGEVLDGVPRSVDVVAKRTPGGAP